MNEVLDPCCGSRMMWFDRGHALATYGDCREETITVTDRTHGKQNGTRTIHIAPDTLMDFRDMPFDDGAFNLIAFDPPHLERAGPKSWLAAKYGKLSDNWRDDMTKGFDECWRVLAPGGTLIFKWNETQVKIREVLACFSQRPLFGHTTTNNLKTHWMVFYKPSDSNSETKGDKP